MDDGRVKIDCSLEISGGLKIGVLEECDSAHEGFERRKEGSAIREVCQNERWMERTDGLLFNNYKDYYEPVDGSSLSSCKQYKDRFIYAVDGFYRIRAEEYDLKVYCDMTTDGGGFTVIQRRVDGSLSFERDWADYKNGFHDDEYGNIYIGNELIHLLSKGEVTLRIDMELKGKEYYAQYSSFDIDDESHCYRIHFKEYSGNAGDSFTYLDGMCFSTADRDNDIYSGNCAQHHKSGYWYTKCHYSHLNGIYGGSVHTGIDWNTLGDQVNLSKVEMKIR